MQSLELHPENIKNIFKEYLPQNNTYFVLPTDTVMNSWIDWIVTNPQESGTDAIAFERFMAWDDFKRDLLNATQENKTAIPTILKKFFVYDLIKKNAEKPKNERFQVIINPDDELCKSADSFTDWICNNLTSLHYWKNKLEKHKDEYGQLDAEDKDYEYLYNEYSNFLSQNDLFEPAWCEQLSLENTTNTYIIFYPELNQDFLDYSEIFENAGNVISYYLPKNIPSPQVYLFPDSRKELRTIMLKIIDLVNSEHIDWSEIALSIPDIDTYRPYIEREFSLYQIPYVIKSGQKLTQNNAGRIFREIYNCYNSDFSFDTVRALVLDECVPWKDEYEQTKEDLIREGNRMRCICSPYEKNIWLSAFNSKIARLENNSDDNSELEYFNNLKKFFLELQATISHFFDTENNTFENIRKCWMEFKTHFLKSDEDFSEEANNILSRCIKELEEIIKIEQDFQHCNLSVLNPFDFFLKTIDSKTYSPQTKATGVNIFKYKLSAAAHFKYQFVIDASQKNLEITYKRLTFLNTTKRIKLHLLDDDKILNPTEVFIKLYAKPTTGKQENFVHFSAATDTFAGYAIPHSLLNPVKKEDLLNLDSYDYVLNEADFLLAKNQSPITKLTPNQKEMFTNWKASRLDNSSQYILSPKLKEKLKNKKDTVSGLYVISPRGDLEKFFPCPRKWLFASLLKLRDDSLDTDLMKSYDMGNLNHKILEEILSDYTDKTLPYYDKEQNLFMLNNNGVVQDYNESFYTKISQSVKDSILKIKDFRDSPLVIRSLQDQTEVITQSIYSFLTNFLKPFETGGFGNCSVYAMEKSLSQEYQNFKYNGRIDCILKTPESDLVIIDFKNSESSTPDAKEYLVDDNGKLQDFQMAIYYSLVKDTTQNDIYRQDYCIVKKGDIKNVYAEPKLPKGKDFETFEPSVSVTKDYAQIFVDTLNNEKLTPFNSNNERDKLDTRSYENCIDCTFKSICRTTYTIGSKTIEKGETKNV